MRGEMRRLLEAAPAGYRTAIVCGLFSGLRLSELLALTWRDVTRTSVCSGAPPA